MSIELLRRKRTFDELQGTSDDAVLVTDARKLDGNFESPHKQRNTGVTDDSPDLSESASEAPPEDDLPPLLDFTKLDTQHDISARFAAIADALLHQYRIEITTSSKVEQLELLEVEFYLYKSGCHEDPFTHGSVEQGQAGNWYFHRPPSRSNELGTPTAFASGYRGGTRKGLDITIGRPPPAVTSKYFSSDASNYKASTSASSQAEGILRGGILLRSVRRVIDGKVISGPSLLVDEVLRLSGASKIADLVTDIWQNDISAFSAASPSQARRSTMRLVRTATTSTTAHTSNSSEPGAVQRIYSSPRIGLDITHPSITPSNLHTHPRVHFVGQPYRFFSRAHAPLLTANGRGQTFLGVYDALTGSPGPGYDPYDAELLRALERATGWKLATVKNCHAEYMAGLEGHCDGGRKSEEVLRQWMGRGAKGAAASMTGFLRMMGTLRRVLKEAGDAAVVGKGD